ncbi:MAG: hypothetical protein GTN98_15585 [Woeseiaceae bacterium]|nr:hypothetical protein [Woeseiaceae bacterium]
MGLFAELKRRNVIRVGTAYAVTAWLLIQVAATTFPLFGYDETPARIVVIIFAVGFIPTLVLTWVFELTPAGLRKDSEVDRSPKVDVTAVKRFDRIVMIILAVAVAFFSFDRFALQKQRELEFAKNIRIEILSSAIAAYQTNKSIAVLPFTDLSADRDHEYIADGIAEELLNQLGKLEELNVASRRSSFTFKGTTETSAAIASKLGVEYLLEGSVRKDDEQLRVTAQLVEIREGAERQVWSRSFDETYGNIFYVQEEIAKAVAAALSIALDVDGRNHLPGTGTDNIQAYDALLEGRDAMARLGPAYAEPHYRRATEIDPEYAQAWLASGVSVGLQTDKTAPADTQRHVERGRDLVMRAIELDPTLAEAYARLAAFNRVLGDFPAAFDAANTAAELAPGDITIQMSRNGFFHRLGHIREGIRGAELRRQIEPLAYFRAQTLAELYIQNRRYDKAREILEISSSFPARDEPSIIKRHFFIALAEKDNAAAGELLRDYANAAPVDAPLLSPVIDAFDAPPARLLETLKSRYAETVNLTGEGRIITASIAAHFGDPDFALEVLAEEFEVAFGRFHRVWHPFFSDMRKKPEFRQMLIDMGLDRIYREYGWPDLCRPLQNDSFECF